MYGITYKFADKLGEMGTREDRYDDKTSHEVKALAGREFQKSFVQSVCVFNQAGVALLYLKKDETGKCVKREYRQE